MSVQTTTVLLDDSRRPEKPYARNTATATQCGYRAVLEAPTHSATSMSSCATHKTEPSTSCKQTSGLSPSCATVFLGIAEPGFVLCSDTRCVSVPMASLTNPPCHRCLSLAPLILVLTTLILAFVG